MFIDLAKDLGPLPGQLVHAFLPEMLLCFGIVLLLVMRLFKSMDRAHLGRLSLLVVLAALGLSILQWTALNVHPTDKNDLLSAFSSNDILNKPEKAQELFRADGENNGGMLVYDRLTIAIRIFLFSFTALIVVLTLITRIPDREDSADFHVLLLGGTLGMCLMASANHLLMIWIAIEMASLPSYALAGFLKGRRASSEAALKYVVYGGGAAGVMLYGISLLAGKFGTAYVPDLARGVIASISIGGPVDAVVILGSLFVLVGVAFKLAAVPFHFWCPDVFEGASAEVAGFLSVASKGAALALLARLTLTFAGVDPIIRLDTQVGAEPRRPMETNVRDEMLLYLSNSAVLQHYAAKSEDLAHDFATIDKVVKAFDPDHPAVKPVINTESVQLRAEVDNIDLLKQQPERLEQIKQYLSKPDQQKKTALTPTMKALNILSANRQSVINSGKFAHLKTYLISALAFFAVLTMTVGNLAAYMQTNLKRLLAYSTIAHAGYMMMALTPLTPAGTAAMLYYLIAYLFMNLGAFAVIAFLRNQTGSEDLKDFRGLVRRSPWMVVTLSVFLLSLLGIPPLVGFFAKFQIFGAIFDASAEYRQMGEPGLGTLLFGLLLIGGLNTVLSAVYYVKVMKVMILDKGLDDIEGTEPEPVREPILARSYAALMALAVLVLGIIVNPVVSESVRGADRYRPAGLELPSAPKAGEGGRPGPGTKDKGPGPPAKDKSGKDGNKGKGPGKDED
jgi:NADH-quinone oxidoreductase subunit N